MNDFLKGLRYPLEGFRLVSKPRIRLYVLIPFIVNSFLFLLVIYYGAHQILGLSEWLSTRWDWAEWLQWILWPLFIMLSVTVVFFTFTLVANLISAPFNGFLAASVEQYLAGKTAEMGGSLSELPMEILADLRNEARKFVYFLMYAVPLLVLFFIPMVNAAAPLAWLLFSSWMLSLEYLDFPMSNQGLYFNEIRKRIRYRRSLCMGFGFGTLLMTMIPVLNFLAMPVAVTAATKLWIDELKPHAHE